MVADSPPPANMQNAKSEYLAFITSSSLHARYPVFNALHTRFGPSKYTSLKTTLQNAAPN